MSPWPPLERAAAAYPHGVISQTTRESATPSSSGKKYGCMATTGVS